MWIVTIATIYLVHGTTFAVPGGVPGGYSMLITFQEFELETHGSCAYDYVQNCEGNNLCGKKLCGRSLPDPITVEFHSDGSVSRKGFNLTSKKIRPEGAAFSIHGGPSAREGNTFFGGRPICDDFWDNTDAGVFCRMMGYQNGNATHMSTYGQVSSDFSMDDVQCNGHETNLIDCNHTTLHNCGSSEGAGVICSGFFTSIASSLEAVTATTTESPSTITTDTEWDEYIESLSTNTIDWEDWEPSQYEPEIIDAMACSDGQMLDDEECVPDPTFCYDGRVFDGQRCVLDPRNCPYGYFVEDGKCELDPSIPILDAMLLGPSQSCRCRAGYHFSVRRRSQSSPSGSCIRCRRRRTGRNRCGC